MPKYPRSCQSCRSYWLCQPWLLSWLFFFVTVLGLGLPAAWGDIRVRAEVSPQQAEVGDVLTLVIEVQGAQNVNAPAPDEMDGLDDFEISYIGPSSRMSIVNTQVNSSVQHRYALQARKEGQFTLGPFTVAYEGQQYQTAAVRADIVPSRRATGRPSQTPSQSQYLTNQPRAAKRDFWVEITTPKQEVYLHEQLPVEVTLYVGGVRLADAQYPVLPGDGLSVEPFEEPVRRRQQINGQNFRILRFRTSVVPLRSGSIDLGPASLDLSVIGRSSRRRGSMGSIFDRLFPDSFMAMASQPRTLESNPLTLSVLPLPEEGKPALFSGAVGRFSMDVTASPTQLPTGDPLTLHMAVRGRGHLSDAQPPVLSSTEGFRTYTPQTDHPDEETTVFEQVLIPQDETLSAIPSVHFSYFDPGTRRYQTIESQPIGLVLGPSPYVQRTEIVGGNGSQVATAEQLGRDIVYIKDDPGQLRQRATAWYQSTLFLFWHAVPLALFGAAVWYDRRRQRWYGDVRYARFRQAGKEAQQGLAQAEQALAGSDSQVFYETLSHTLQEYLAAKLDLPPGRIDADAISGCGVPHDCEQRIHEIITKCEYVRFAPGSGDGDLQSMLAAVQDIVNQLEREQTFPVAVTARAA